MVCGIWFFGVAYLEGLIIVCVKKSAVVFLTRAILFCGAAQFSQRMFMVKAVLLLMAERNSEQQTSLEMRRGGNSQTPAPATTVQRFEEIRVLSTLESADGQKSPISRMRESLDKVGKSRENFVEESKANDGSRYAQINVAGSIFCVKERRGLINFSGIDEKPIVTQPIGKKCRRGQY